MAESTLTLSITDLKAEIGHYLGYGRGSAVYGETAWTTSQGNNITAVLKSGLAQVYTPPPVAPGEVSHNWSFLRPFDQITLLAGDYSVQLPDDFGGFEGPLYVMTEGSRQRTPIKVTNEGVLQNLLTANPDMTGPPRIAAEAVQKATSLTGSNRSILHVHPKADKDYVLAYVYKYLPDALTGSLPYPPGGSEHSELFKASCLAAAELQLDDANGPRWQFFMQRLIASVHADRKRKGDFVGYNGDRSDGRDMPGFRDHGYYGNRITYNGNDM